MVKFGWEGRLKQSCLNRKCKRLKGTVTKNCFFVLQYCILTAKLLFRKVRLYVWENQIKPNGYILSNLIVELIINII